MNQKIKIVVLIVIVIVLIVVGVIIFKKNNPANVNMQTQQKATQATTPKTTVATTKKVTQATTQEKSKVANTIVGKLRSLNEKQIYIELADGKGSAINIVPTTPVLKEGETTVKDLTSLQPNAMVSVTVDESLNAIEILVKK